MNTNPVIDWLKDYWRMMSDFIVFVTEFAYIEDKETSMAIPFHLWPSQVAIMPKLLNSDRLIILKARQLGLTWMVACYCLWTAITKPLQLIVVISAKEDWAIELVDRIKFVLSRLPAQFLPPIAKQTSQILEFVHVDTSGSQVNSTIKSLPTTEEGAQSKTPTLLIIDESALNRYFKSIFASSKPGLDVAKGRMIVISNSIKTAPGWPETRKIYQGSMRGDNDFERIFMPWWDRPDRPKDFRTRQLREGMAEEDFTQHYPETEEEAISTMLGSYFGRTLARHNQTMQGITGDLLIGGKSPADIIDIKQHIANNGDDIEFIPNPRGILEIWRFPYYLSEGWNGDWYTKMYGIGSDVSEGLGLSFSVAYGIDRLLDEIVFRCRSNRIDAFSWANYLYVLGRWYRSATSYTNKGLTYEDACLCVERTGAGQTTTDLLKKLNANQYMTEVLGTAGAPIKKTFGWSETEQAKHDLSEGLRNWLKVTRGTVYCPVLIDEASTWIQYEGTRRLGPEEGKYGDCVIAAGCAVQAGNFMGGSPQKLAPPTKGWLRKWQKEGDQARVWAIN